MWICTKHGFISVVAHRDKTGVVLVRARVKAHLEAFVREYGPYMGIMVAHTPEADYPYRVIVSRWDFSVMITNALDDINYPNFKNEAAKLGDVPYDDFLHNTWINGKLHLSGEGD